MKSPTGIYQTKTEWSQVLHFRDYSPYALWIRQLVWFPSPCIVPQYYHSIFCILKSLYIFSFCVPNDIIQTLGSHASKNVLPYLPSHHFTYLNKAKSHTQKSNFTTSIKLGSRGGLDEVPSSAETSLTSVDASNSAPF